MPRKNSPDMPNLLFANFALNQPVTFTKNVAGQWIAIVGGVTVEFNSLSEDERKKLEKHLNAAHSLMVTATQPAKTAKTAKTA